MVKRRAATVTVHMHIEPYLQMESLRSAASCSQLCRVAMVNATAYVALACLKFASAVNLRLRTTTPTTTSPKSIDKLILNRIGKH